MSGQDRFSHIIDKGEDGAVCQEFPSRPGENSPAGLREWIARAQEKRRRIHPRGSSSVLIPILIRDGSFHVLYEVRSSKLHTQPGEVCFPGGRIETGETPLEAAIRETTEELCVRRDQIEIVGELENTVGPGGIPFYSFVGVLHDYDGTWSGEEVEGIFTLPLDWILSREPDIYQVKLENRIPEDFPFELIPGGRSYHWRSRSYPVPFYPGTNPILWGMTARVTHSLARLLRLAAGEDCSKNNKDDKENLENQENQGNQDN